MFEKSLDIPLPFIFETDGNVKYLAISGSDSEGTDVLDYNRSMVLS